MPNTLSFGHLPIDDIELDLGNPRIAKWIEMYGNEITSEQMALALGAGDTQGGDSGTTFHSLRESIRTNRGIIHPIIINRDGSGRHVAIEGNTRVLIYREFREKGTEGEWDTIPAILYERLTDSEIDAIRLQAHLVGPRAWDPYSKAKYLDRLQNSRHLTLAQIVDFCGGRKQEVSDYINAYHDMETHYRQILSSDDEFDPSRFSAFVELQRPRVRQAIVDAGFKYTDFAKWVHSRAIHPLNTVRQLPRILADERARTEFLKSGAKAALKILDLPTADAALGEIDLEALARELSRRIAQLPYEEIRRLRADLGSDDNITLCDARDALQDLCRDLADE